MEGQMNDKKLNRRYAAGIVDGEGYVAITIQKQRQPDGSFATWHRPCVKVAMTDPTVIRLLVQTLGGHVHMRTYENPRFRNAFMWEVRSFASVQKALDFFGPYLIVKRPQAQVLEDFLTTKCDGQNQFNPSLKPAVLEKRQRLYHLMRKLNRRGSPPAETESERSLRRGRDEATVRTIRSERIEASRNAMPGLTPVLSQN